MVELNDEKTEIMLKKTLTRQQIEAFVGNIKIDCGEPYEAGSLDNPEAMEEFLNWDYSMPTPSGRTFDDLMEHVAAELNRLEDDPDFDFGEYTFYSIVEWLGSQFGTKDEIELNTCFPGDDE